MEVKTEIIYLTIFLVLIIILTPGIVKDLKQLIAKKDFNDNMQYYFRWTLPGVVLCLGGILALIRLVIILMSIIF
jgi:hypothetical protein